MRYTHFLGLLLVAAAILNWPDIHAYGQDRPANTASASTLESQKVRDFSDETLAKVVPGHTTKAEVEALLGKPWRDTDFTTGDDALGIDIWEYRGKDPNGTYRVHIEFNDKNITTLIAKIPDKTAQGVARTAPPSQMPTPPKE